MLALRVCSIPQAQQDRTDEIGLVRSRLQSQLAPGASWCGEDHLLAADSIYRLKVSTQVRKWRDGQELDAIQNEQLTFFRTQGPPGFFKTEGPAGFEAQGPLRDLSAYVSSRSSVPRDGARAIYRGYDVRVVFDANYMERLYNGTGHDLSVSLFDQNGRNAQSAGGAPAAVAVEWDRDPYGAAVEDQQWSWAIHRSADCAVSLPSDCFPRRSSLEARLREAPLAPQSLVEARVAATGRPLLHRFTFTTSRFVTFIHHLQSFRGEINDVGLGAAGAASSLAANASTQLREVVQARRQSGPAFDAAFEPLAFDELIAQVFDLERQPASDGIELTLLHDDARRYALLLESPEPLDWSRTSLRLGHATTSPPVGMSSRGRVKLIDATLPPNAAGGTADFNAEWIELLIVADANRKRLQHRA